MESTVNNEHMGELDPTAPISEQASHWYILFRGGNATRADKKAFGEWVSRSPERIEAYIQAARLTTALKSRKVRWPDTPVEILVREATATPADIVALFPSDAVAAKPAAHRSGRKPRPLMFAMAATLLVALGCVWVLLPGPQRYATAFGEQRSIVLSDGSVVTLNTSSSIEVTLAKTRRTIKLVAGEALFQVAHDKTRPFDVVAGNTTVRAVGTQFDVDRRASSTTVTVVEGKVSVATAPENPGDESPGRDAPIPVSAGEEVILRPRTPPHTAPANVAIATAWTQRRLVFERRPLGEVAAEFNRYNRQEIRIESAKLSGQEVTGMFQANDPNSFLDFIAKIPGVKIEQHADSFDVVSVN
jgi:transmembrane sensor